MQTGAWGICCRHRGGKGLLVLTVGFGLLESFHRDAQHVAERLVATCIRMLAIKLLIVAVMVHALRSPPRAKELTP